MKPLGTSPFFVSLLSHFATKCQGLNRECQGMSGPEQEVESFEETFKILAHVP